MKFIKLEKNQEVTAKLVKIDNSEFQGRAITTMIFQDSTDPETYYKVNGNNRNMNYCNIDEETQLIGKEITIAKENNKVVLYNSINIDYWTETLTISTKPFKNARYIGFKTIKSKSNDNTYELLEFIVESPQTNENQIIEAIFDKNLNRKAIISVFKDKTQPELKINDLVNLIPKLGKKTMFWSIELQK